MSNNDNNKLWYLIQFSLHSLLYGGMTGEDAQRPAQHHRLGLGADDEYLPEDGGQTLLRERVLALVHLLQVQVLKKGGEKSVVESSMFLGIPDPDPLVREVRIGLRTLLSSSKKRKKNLDY
jgi:hypothetical protein